MSSTSLNAESALMFYPTDMVEVYRILGLIGNIRLPYGDGETKLRHKIGFDVEKRLKLSDEGYYNYANIAYNYLLNESAATGLPFDTSIFHYNLSHDRFSEPNTGNEGKFVVADLFCGEGEWLNAFRLFEDKNVVTVGNEVEEGRYKIASKKLTKCYNFSFEDLQLPKKFVNVYLFNPPYGGMGSDRNAVTYLQMSIDRQYLIEGGLIVCVLNVKDMLKCAKILAENFETKYIYKVNDKEFQKYNQLVYIGKRLNRQDAWETQNRYNTLTEIIQNSKLEFDPKWYSDRRDYYNVVDLAYIFSVFQINRSEKDYNSNPKGRLWRGLKARTSLPDREVEKITMPIMPTDGGVISNLLAAGYVDGTIDGGDSPHIISGGTRIVETSAESIGDTDESGDGPRTLVTTKQSVPVVMVLYTSEQGEIIIKELK